MTEPNERGRGRKPDVFTSQLRHFDEQLSDFRSQYDNFTADERSGFRAWLERVEVLYSEGHEWNALLKVRTEYDVCDAAGNTLRWADADFSPKTMLAAVRAWDAGEDFAPSSVLP